MNLFFLSTSIKKAARYHVNRHVVKMILETTQLLSTAVRVLEPTRTDEWLYRATHRNHPWARWVRRHANNYTFACRFGLALCREYTHRYDREHACQRRIEQALVAPPTRFDSSDDEKHLLVEYGDYRLTSIPLCMPDEYRRPEDAVASYRAYYAGAKQQLHAWRRRERPEWLDEPKTSDDECAVDASGPSASPLQK